MKTIQKYKHHLIIIIALLSIRLIVVPTWEEIDLNAEKIRSIDSRLVRVEHLVSIKDELQNTLVKSQGNLAQVLPYVYNISDESEFKLIAQRNIEKVLSESGCKTEQIGWEGFTEVNENLKQWRIQASFKGFAQCLVTSMRVLESLKPITRIDTFFYGGQEINRDINREVTARLNLLVWQYGLEQQP